MLALVEDGVDRRRCCGGDACNHNDLHVVLEEEPSLAPVEVLGAGGLVSHGNGTDEAVGSSSNESLRAGVTGRAASQGRGAVIDSDTRDEVPVPGSDDVFVFVAVDVCIDRAIGKVEAKVVGIVRALGVLRPRRIHPQGRDVAGATLDLLHARESWAVRR